MTTTDPIRVTHTVASIRGDHGGPSRSVSFLCRALAQQGLDVRLVTTIPQTYEPDAAPILPGPEVELRAASVPRAWSLYRAWRHPPALHDHGVWLPTAIAATAARQPLMITTCLPRGRTGVVGGRYSRRRFSCDRRSRGRRPAGVRI